LEYFRRQPFVYTLSPPLLGDNGIDEFLFDTRRGFCEHFAGAFVFLMRAAGLPARVVTGYQGGEVNPVDGYLLVRQSDAHAWAEVWLAGRGWTRVDPTAAVAPNRIERGVVSALPEGDPLPFMVRTNLDWIRKLRFQWEALGNSWDQWVIGYNSDRQREVLTRLGMKQPDWQSMAASMAALTGAIMLGLAAWTIRQRARLDPAQRAWRLLSRKLSRVGLRRRPDEGPMAYSKRIRSAQPGLAEETSAIAGLYAAIRYGRDADASLQRDLMNRVRRLRIAQ
jgi:transglutaminase-like putative cysteine protease